MGVATQLCFLQASTQDSVLLMRPCWWHAMHGASRFDSATQKLLCKRSKHTCNLKVSLPNAATWPFSGASTQAPHSAKFSISSLGRSAAV